MTQQQRHSPVAILRTALALVLIAIGVAAALGWLAAWREVGEHGYLERGFARCAFLTLRDGSRALLGVGSKWGAALGAVFALVAFAVGRWGVDGRPENLVRAAASRVVVAWTVVAMSLSAVAALIVLEQERGWIGSRDVGYAIAFTLASAIVLVAISRRATRADSGETPATIVAMLGAFAFLAPTAFWLGRVLPYHPSDRGAWTSVALAVLTGVLLFPWIRARTRAEIAGRRVSWFLGPLGAGASLSAVLALAPFVYQACASSLGAPAFVARQPWNVVVIGIDTLRYDELSLFGSNPRGRDTTPNLRRLAERGVVFDAAMSQAPWTLPAFASIVTGVYPHEHGAYSLTGRLRNREVTLAEVLREAGYQTFGVVSQVYLEKGSGFEQGCDQFDDSAVTSEHESNGERTSDAALRALARVDASKPFFAFVHYFDPHSDYVEHKGWTWADGYKGWLREQMAFDNLERNRDKLDAADLQYIRDVYDEECAFTDQQIGRVLDELDRRGLSEHTLIVLVVDHGDQFLDHGNFGHTTTLYDELVHVPLIVVPPGSKQASRRADVVETRNVFGTVLDVLGIESCIGAKKRWSADQSRSLLAAAEPERPAFSIVWLPDSKPSSGKLMCASAVREGRWKLVHDWTRDKRMLFDLEADPRELDDRFAAQPELAARLLKRLDDWTTAQRERGGSAALRAMDKRSTSALSNLGYLGDEKK